MKRFLSHFLILSFLSFSLLLEPHSVLAQDSIVPCGKNGGADCTFSDFIILLKNIFNFIILWLVAPAVTLSFFYAGYLYLVHPTNPGKRGEANEVAKMAVWGLVIALGSYLIVSTIVGALVEGENKTGLLRYLDSFK